MQTLFNNLNNSLTLFNVYILTIQLEQISTDRFDSVKQKYLKLTLFKQSYVCTRYIKKKRLVLLEMFPEIL